MSAVLELLGWPSESDVRDAAGCFWDAIRGVLVSCDSSKQLEIDKGCLMGMVSVGILFLSVDEFGDDSFTLNSAAIRWREHQIIEHGTTDPLHHLRPGAEEDHCKLSVVMLLASQGWRPIAEHAALDFHCVSSDPGWGALKLCIERSSNGSICFCFIYNGPLLQIHCSIFTQDLDEVAPNQTVWNISGL